jgi:hypothetical protein
MYAEVEDRITPMPEYVFEIIEQGKVRPPAHVLRLPTERAIWGHGSSHGRLGRGFYSCKKLTRRYHCPSGHLHCCGLD